MAGYDAFPFKLRPCPDPLHRCKRSEPEVLARDLPPTGASVPAGDHWHVLPRGGADSRGARDLQQWKTLMLSTTRCEHGRTHGDSCLSCPTGWSESRAGIRVGTTVYGAPVVIPPREEHNNPDAWIQGDSPT